LVKAGKQKLNFKLRKGSGPAGLVLLPGGEPATNATVFLYEAMGGIYVDKPGQYRKDLGTLPENRQTDSEGRFFFPAKLDARGLLVMHDMGFAEVPMAAFNGKISLQPWGRVEGQFVVGSEPARNAKIMLKNLQFRYGQNGRDFPALALNLEAITDDQGNFVFEKVPAGERKISCHVTKPGSQLGRLYETQGRPILVAAGTSTRVKLGGTGRTIVGRSAFFSAADSIDWKTATVELKLQLPTGPGSRPDRASFSSNEAFIEAMKAFAQADRTFWSSDKGHETERAQRSYAAFCNADGSFLLADIPAGRYELQIELPDSKKDSLGPSQVAFDQPMLGSLLKEINVSEAKAGQTPERMDLGILELKPVPRRSVRVLGYR